MLNLNKYNKKKFNSNSKINERIKVLFLLFDKYVIEGGLDYHQKQKLINVWIDKFINYEEYEVAEAFKQRKIRMWKKWRKLHRLTSLDLFYRAWKSRINKIFRKLKSLYFFK